MFKWTLLCKHNILYYIHLSSSIPLCAYCFTRISMINLYLLHKSSSPSLIFGTYLISQAALQSSTSAVKTLFHPAWKCVLFPLLGWNLFFDLGTLLCQVFRNSPANLSFVLLRNFRISLQRRRRRAGRHRSLRVSLRHEILHPPVDVVGRSLCCPADFTVRDNSPQRAIPTDSLPTVSPKERKDPMSNSSSATGGFSHSDRSQSSPSL